MIRKRMLDGEWQRPYWVQWFQTLGCGLGIVVGLAIFMHGLIEAWDAVRRMWF